MKNEESERERLQPSRTFDLNINNPVAISKKSEKEKIIEPKIDNNPKSKKEENIQEDEDEIPINNYPYEFYDDSQDISEPKTDELNIQNQPIKENNVKKLENQENQNGKNNQIKKRESKSEKINKETKPKIEAKKENRKNMKKESKKEVNKIEIKPKEEIKLKSVPKKEEKNIEKPKKEEISSKNGKSKKENKIENHVIEVSANKNEKKIEKPGGEEIQVKKEIKKEQSKNEEIKNERPKKEEIKKEQPKNEEIKNEQPKKEEIKKEQPKKEQPKKEEPKKEEIKKEQPKKEEIKKEEPKKEEVKKEEPKKEEIKKEKPKILIEQKINGQKNEEIKVKGPEPENEGKIQELTLERVDYKEFENPHPPREEIIPPKIKETKDLSKVSEIINNGLPKTLLTKKTEDNYDTMMKYFKDTNYKRSDDYIIGNIINYDDFSSDQFLGIVSDKIKMDITNKNMIKDFLQRNEDDTQQRIDNNKNINDRIKLIEDSTKKKLYFNNKQSQQDYFDSFYNRQMEYKNNYKDRLDKLTKKCNEENSKNYVPEQKNKNNLSYFQNNEPVKISKYSFKYKNINKNNEENSKENDGKDLSQPKFKRLHSFDPNQNQKNNKTNDDKELNNNNSKNNNDSKKLKKIKSGPLFQKNEIKLTEKEIADLTNKLHYDGELLKIKKQDALKEEFTNNLNYHNFSKEKLTYNSIIILIKTIIYQYSMSLKKNAYADIAKNPKINYEQYIDILKDLYYLDKEALPEDYLEEDTMYKELWNKLTMFSKGPENSIESNVFLLFLLELNGFFNNEKIVKQLENEIYWIKLEEYDDLIANSKYIQDNWDDLKDAKLKNIKKLKLEGKYNPIHSGEIYGNNIQLINGNSIKNGNSINGKSNHYITTFKGNTNYHIIHGYSSNNKDSENKLLGFHSFFNKNEENKNSVFSLSNASIKNLKNRLPLKDSYNDLILKKKSELENKKKDEEEKLKEICTFKPHINTINKQMFSKIIKVELPKYKKNKSLNLYNNSLTKENISTINNSNMNTLKSSNQENNNICNTENNINNRKISKYNNHNYLSIKYLKTTNQSKSPNIKKEKEKINQNILKRNKSTLQKMFEDNPLKNDKVFYEKIQKLKISRNNRKELENNNNNYFAPMRFDLEYPSKFEDLGVTVNKDAKMKQRTQNVIFYNIKINEKIKTLKYIEGDDLKLNVINFVRKNRLPEEVTDIILTKIKEKTIEEIL